MPNDSSKRVQENVESIQSAFQRVLDDHGIADLRVSQFRLSPAVMEEATAASALADASGCWKWICELTPSGQVCHKVWDPNC